jgi:hypothetical protein
MCAVLSVVADDLHKGEQKGYLVTDASRMPGDPSREFRVKVILLFMQGDYKAQALNCGQTHQGGFPCHWCKHNASKISGVGRTVSGDYGSYYPRHHQNRPANAPAEPAPRTHHETCVAGITTGAARDRLLQSDNVQAGIGHIAGVKVWCPLAALELFDVVWDFVPDMMHIVLNLLKVYVVRNIKGERKIKAPTLLTLVGYEDEEKGRRKRQNQQTTRVYEKAKKVITSRASN